MTVVESAWPKYPDYRIDLVPIDGIVRVWADDVLLAETSSAVRLEETDHVDRIYLPRADVRWEHFEATDTHTICPFKGEADYWSVTAIDPPLVDVVWAYPTPLDEVAGIAELVCFYQDRVRIELTQTWPDGREVRNLLPAWGDAADLLGLMDVEPAGDGRFVGPPYRDRTRNVVEGGQMLGAAIVAATKTVPNQRVVSAHMLFPKAASFDDPLDFEVDVLRGGRSFSTVEVRVGQLGQLRSVGLLLLDAGAPDVIHGSAEMPDVGGPDDAEPLDMRVTGRELRVLDGLYDPDPDRIGPPVIHTWCRFRDAPAHPWLHAALLAQSTTHWTIAAAMLPHAGFGEADAHVTLSTGIMSVSLALHDEVDVTDWLLYENPAIYAGRGLVQGQGRVFTEAGVLVASYSVQGMVRGFPGERAPDGFDASNAM